MNWLARRWQGFANQPKAIGYLLLLAVLLHIGSSIGGSFYADDFVQRVYAVGSEALAAKGLLDGIDTKSFFAFISNQFNFFNPVSENYGPMQAFGMIPWWAGENAMLHFFRPLAAATHYIDYQLWPDNPRIMHFISLIWYVAGLYMIYRLYQAVAIGKAVALLALTLIILDLSVFQVVTWIASRSMLMVIAIGFFAVYAYHRSIESKCWYGISLIALLLALLSAEGAIGICAYLGAYMFTLDNRAWKQRIIHILPFAVLTVCWHIAYQKAGFGAYGVDFYLDPGREPIWFLQTALYRLPGNFFELSSGVDFMSGQLRPDIRAQAFAIAGCIVLSSILWLLWPQLRREKNLQFFLLGSLFALVPGLTIALAPRVMILPNVGFAIVLATLMLNCMQGTFSGVRKLVAIFYTGYAFLMHGLIAIAFALLMNINSIQAAFEFEAPQSFIDLGLGDVSDQHIVVLNSLQPFWLAFYGHQLDYQGKALPETVRLLTSSFYSQTLTRVTENTLRIEGHPAIQLDRYPVDGYENKEPGHFIYLTWQLMGLIRSEREIWQVGDQFYAPEMHIEVEALYEGKPSSLLITLYESLDRYRWVYQDLTSQGRDYREFNLPEIEQSQRFEGVFSARQNAQPVSDIE